jgi:hypothetical protein
MMIHGARSEIMKKTLLLIVTTALLAVLSVGVAAADPSVTLDPTYAARHFKDTSGEKEPIRIHIKLSGAANLLNFSVKVTYDPVKLKILEYHVNDTTWNFVQNSYYKDNDLYMFGASSTPVSGDVLIGWLVVEHNGGLDDTPALTTFNVELAGETVSGFDNFVTSAGAVVDTSVIFTGAESELFIPNHYDTNACQGDFDGDGDVDGTDYARFYAAYPSTFPAANYDPAADIDADGDVDDDDKSMFDEDYNQTLPCPVYGGHEIVTSHDEIGGDIYPGPDTSENGHVSVADGAAYTFQILPEPNYSVSDVVVDDVSALASCTKSGADYSYTFTSVTLDHTLHASFCNLPGDIDGNGQVSGSDYVLFRLAFGSNQGEPNYNSRADIDQNGSVLGSDYIILRTNYNLSCE